MDFYFPLHYAHVMHLTSSSQQGKWVKEIVLKAMGHAISKTVAITEIIKVCLFSLLSSHDLVFIILIIGFDSSI
jgi:DNA-binding protein